MERKNLRFIAMICIFISITATINVQAAQELCETNQAISGYNPISQVAITAYAPFRVGDIGTGADYNAAITSQYNQPRYESSTKRVHKGVDLQALNNSTGRNVFPVYGAGMVKEVYYYTPTTTKPAPTTSYGYYTRIEHQYSSGGLNYYFQSFYGHLQSCSLTTTSTYGTAYTTKLGVEGKTGATNAIHLHLEFRTPGSGTYCYAPAAFYWSKGAWGTNTSFINRTSVSGNKVTFNIVSYDNGTAVPVPASKVKIYYKKDGSTSSFTSAPMTKSTSGNTFTYTFSGNTTGTKIRYYVQAIENCWDGQDRYAYRPYFDRLSVAPPVSSCFLHTMATTTASINQSDLLINSGKTTDQIAQELIVEGGGMEPQLDIPWTPSEESIKKGLESNDISFMAKIVGINTDGSIVVESVTGAETLKKIKYDTFESIKTDKAGKQYAVQLDFTFTPEVGKVYRLKGQYDTKSKIITVYNNLFFNEYYED